MCLINGKQRTEEKRSKKSGIKFKERMKGLGQKKRIQNDLKSKIKLIKRTNQNGRFVV